MAAFPDLPRPTWVESYGGKRNPWSGVSGLQGAHMIGEAFWTRNLKWIADI